MRTEESCTSEPRQARNCATVTAGLRRISAGGLSLTGDDLAELTWSLERWALR